ncbi:hypothetical protein AB0E59_45855 [Lentzea sp. NPDC034063]|uniref:hypothetical protein n=1 Tax=unclassified Lentzea TaxID=2643253 RepID=UPI0033EC2BD7
MGKTAGDPEDLDGTTVVAATLSLGVTTGLEWGGGVTSTGPPAPGDAGPVSATATNTPAVTSATPNERNGSGKPERTRQKVATNETNPPENPQASLDRVVKESSPTATKLTMP